MNKLSRKLMISVFTLVLTFVALGATTFAWFTLGTTAKVDPFDVEVKGSEGLEIQFAGKQDWFTSISTDKMKEYLFDDSVGKFYGKKLDAVTTKDGKSFLRFDGLDGNKVKTKEAGANTDYLEFTLNFRTKQADMKLTLDNVLLTSNELKTWKPDTSFTNEFGNLVETTEPNPTQPWSIYAHHAARVSFTGKNVPTTNTYQDSAAAAAGNISFDLAKGAHDYLARKAGLTDTLEEPHADYSNYVNSATPTTSITPDTNNISETFSTPANGEGYYTTSITVRIWIEGWDGNAYDAIFSQAFSTSFGFKLVSVTTTP